MFSAATIKKRFFSILSDAEAHISDFVVHPGKDMTRHRICSFRDTFLMILTASSNRTNTELLQYFAPSGRIPSRSAFSQQRRKLSDSLFPHVFHSFNRATPFVKKWHGLHLVAVDGSDINLPTDKYDSVYAVTHPASGRCYYQLHLNAAYDLLEERYRDVVIQPRPAMNESAAFCEIVSRYPDKKTLFIADRGYITLHNLSCVLEHDQFFLIRAKAPSSSGSFLRGLIQDDIPCDIELSLSVSRNRKNKKVSDSLHKYVKPTRVFGPIPPDDRSSVYTMPLRILAFPLPNGSFEYLVTNLPKKKFSSSDIQMLYRMRWGIETSFRSLKYAVSAVYFHAVSRRLVIQELFARLILYNFASLLRSSAEKELSPYVARRYRVSFEDSVPIARCFLRGLIPRDKIKTLLFSHMTEIRQSLPKTRYVRSQSVKPLNNRA